MVKVDINGLEFLVKNNISVLEACKIVGIFLPRFCYHESLSVAGNCRMCLIEIQNMPKPMTACALPVLPNMKIWLNSPMVKKARENVLEALLINHPLDCPICDQGGECDLQDQSRGFGTDRSRMFFNKRGVVDKTLSGFILGIMTRCIHCTRCVRFMSEICSTGTLGTLNRGTFTEIGNYHEFFNNETFLSGNIIDLCPVGALTSKSYSFKARPWELKSLESIDLTDGLGSSIYINFKETEIVRILPKINATLNDSFISDKARFFFDSLTRYRLFSGYTNINNKVSKISKINILEELERFIFNSQSTVILVSAENAFELFLLLQHLTYKFANILNVKTINNLISDINIKCFKPKSFSTQLSVSNLIVLVSTNLQLENLILNTKLRQKSLLENISLYGLVNGLNMSYPLTFVNFSLKTFINIIRGKCLVLSGFKLLNLNPFFIFGESIYFRGFKLENLITHISKYLPHGNYLTIRIFSNSFGLEKSIIKPVVQKDYIFTKFIILVNLIDKLSVVRGLYSNKVKYAVLSSFSNKFLRLSRFIIPISTVLESGVNTFFNLEGRNQSINNKVLFFADSLSAYNVFEYCFQYTRSFLELNLFFIKNNNLSLIFSTNTFDLPFTFERVYISCYPLKSIITDFFLTSIFTQTSKILSKVSQQVRHKTINF